MHPEIKKFWNDIGHVVHGPTSMGSYEIHIPNKNFSIYKIEIVCYGDEYRFNNRWYSEEEMFKIIKLKAFL